MSRDFAAALGRARRGWCLGISLMTALVSAACGGTAPAGAPAEGLLLLDLRTGSVRGASSLGQDPIAVAISADGRTAYVSDNAPGIVRAVALPGLDVRWSTTTGGRPGPLLVTLEGILVSLYESSQVVRLDPATGAVTGRTPTCSGPGQLAMIDGQLKTACAATGFALAGAGAQAWTADYASGTLTRAPDGARLQLPPHLHPFWLAAGPAAFYIAAEGDDEDRDPGGVLEVAGDQVRTLAAGRDVDQVEPAAGRVFAAVHGDRQVLVVDPAGATVAGRWARGSDPVALAADLPLGLLVVVTDARE